MPRPPYKVLSFDHNHSTGEFRGWLCGECNRALGLLGDNPNIVNALYRYLLQHGWSCTRELVF